MNLNDHTSFKQIDPQNMLAHIDTLPQQLADAWELGLNLSLPSWKGIRQVIVAGMGGSAIGGDLVTAYSASTCKAILLTLRDYDLPGWANGDDTLVIAASHSGNTEETLAAYQEAGVRGCRRLAICTGGELERLAFEAQSPVWKFNHHGQPRAAVGFSFGLVLAALRQLELVPDPTAEVAEAVEAMKRQQQKFHATIPAALNPAKRYAGQLMGRWVTVFGAGILSPVARRWKTQINELAKSWAQFEILPEADHNTLVGLSQPEDALSSHFMALFLRCPSDHPRNKLRLDLTRLAFMQQGLNTDTIDAPGEGALSQIWTCLHMGDYVAYYLAMWYKMDPSPVDALQSLKQAMKNAG